MLKEDLNQNVNEMRGRVGVGIPYSDVEGPRLGFEIVEGIVEGGFGKTL